MKERTRVRQTKKLLSVFLTLAMLLGTVPALAVSPEVTPPTLTNAELTYDGNPKALIAAAGSTSGDNMQYGLGQGPSESSAPAEADWVDLIDNVTGTDAGTYYVWYQAPAVPEQYDAVDPTYVGSVTIAKAPTTRTAANVNVANNFVAADGGDKQPAVAVPEGDTIRYRTTDSGDYELTAAPSYTDPGEYTVYYQLTQDNNHEPFEGTFPMTLAGVTLSGTATYGQTLTATAVPNDLTLAWYRGDTADFAHDEENKIAGATTGTYTLTGDDVGKYIKVVGTKDFISCDAVTAQAVAKAKEAAPDDAEAALALLTISYPEETIAVAAGYEVYPDTTIEDFSAILDCEPPTVYVRKAASDDYHAPSDLVQVTLAARPAAPTGLGSTDVTEVTATDGTITGVAATMEYRLAGGSWTDCGGETITNLAAGEYSVRVKATDAAPHGLEAAVTVGSPYAALTEAAPTVTVTKAAGNTGEGPQIGDTLTATPSPADAKPLTYEWYRGTTKIDGATEANYVLTVDDLGAQIHVIAKQAANADGNGSAAVTTAESAPTAAVEKKTGTVEQIGVSDIAVTKTDVTATFTAPAQIATATDPPVYTYEYGYKTSSAEDYTWTTDDTIQGLSPGTEYQFVVRKKGTDDTQAGPVSEVVTLTTDVTVTIGGTPTQGLETTVTLTPTQTGATYKWYLGNSAEPDGTGTKIVPSAGGATLKVKAYQGNTLIGSATTPANVKTLAQVIADAAAPVTVALAGPITGDLAVAAEKEVQLDLNGQKVTGGVAVPAGAALTITDGAGNAGTITGAVTAAGAVTIQGGRYDTLPTVDGDGTVTIQGGLFAADPAALLAEPYAVKESGNADYPFEVYNAYVPLDEQSAPAITVKRGDQVVTEGAPRVGDLLTAASDASSLTYLWFRCEPNEGGMYAERIWDDMEEEISHTAETYTLTPEDYGKQIMAVAFQTKTETGEDYADGQRPEETSELTATVTAPVEAEGRGFLTLADALENVADDAILLLQEDLTENFTVNGADLDLTLDLNGKCLTGTVTVTSGALTILDTTEEAEGRITGAVTANTGDILIQNGRFDEALTAADPGAITIQGGRFHVEPAGEGVTVAQDKWAVQTSDAQYPYCVAEKAETEAAAVAVDQGETDGSADPDKIAEGDLAAAETVAQSVRADLSDAALDQVAQIVDASDDVTGETKNIVIVPALTVTAEEYVIFGENTTLTLNIEAVYVSYETTAEINSAAAVEANKEDETKVKEIGSGTLETAGRPVRVMLQVPADFAEALGAATTNTAGNGVPVYVRHTHEGKNYEYNANLYYSAPDYVVEFVNPNGFSPFTITRSSAAVARLNGMDYTDLQSAVDDAVDGDTITLAPAGEDVTLTARIDTAKTILIDIVEEFLGTLQISAGQGLTLREQDNFDGTVTYTVTRASAGGGGSVIPTYKVAVSESEHGAVAVDPTQATAGTTITITVTPDTGYELDALTVTDADGKSVEVTKKEDGTYTFVQPSGKVTVAAAFKLTETQPQTDPLDAFSDLAKDEWYAEGIRYALENGIMAGCGNGRFDPAGSTSRAMIAQILWNLEGNPQVDLTLPFTDLVAGKWYLGAIRWAVSEKLMDGYGGAEAGRFGPDDPVTREQIVTILHRYAKFKGYDVSVGEDTNILSYDDAFDVSSWAVPAMQWAVGAGIIEGKGSVSALAPRAEASRAELATVMMRFCENVAK